MTRLSMFRERVRWGPCFPCLSCQQSLFRSQVLDYEQKFENVLRETWSENLYRKALPPNTESLYFPFKDTSKLEHKDIQLETSRPRKITFKSGRDIRFICKVCYDYLRKGKLPPKSSLNALEVVHVPEQIRLASYLEEALISRVLLFIKIFSLRSSLMPAIKDKCIVIPLDGKDVINTVESLPRLESLTSNGKEELVRKMPIYKLK